MTVRGKVQGPFFGNVREKLTIKLWRKAIPGDLAFQFAVVMPAERVLFDLPAQLPGEDGSSIVPKRETENAETHPGHRSDYIVRTARKRALPSTTRP